LSRITFAAKLVGSSTTERPQRSIFVVQVRGIQLNLATLSRTPTITPHAPAGR
jgi:hypothetical protein